VFLLSLTIRSRPIGASYVTAASYQILCSSNLITSALLPQLITAPYGEVQYTSLYLPACLPVCSSHNALSYA